MAKKRNLRKRIRDWLKKRKEWKEENPLPSFADRWNRNQEQLEKHTFYRNEEPTEE